MFADFSFLILDALIIINVHSSIRAANDKYSLNLTSPIYVTAAPVIVEVLHISVLLDHRELVTEELLRPLYNLSRSE